MQLPRAVLILLLVGLVFIVPIPTASAVTTTGYIDGVIDEQELVECHHPEILKLTDNVFLLQYGDGDGDGNLVTFPLYDNGDIGPYIDKTQFDPIDRDSSSTIEHPDNDNVYIIAYDGVHNDGWIYSKRIFDNGHMNDVSLDTYEFDKEAGQTPHIIHIHGDVFAIAWQGVDSDGWLATFDIDSNGGITGATHLDNIEWDATLGKDPTIAYYTDNIYVIGYEDTGNNGTILTIDIADNGSIGEVQDTFVYATVNGEKPGLHMDDDICVVFYQGAADDGWAESIRIENTGIITGTLDTYEFAPANGFDPAWVFILENTPHIYAVAYEGPMGDGWISTFEMIEETGDLPDANISDFEFEDVNCDYPDLIYMHDDIYIVAYQDEIVHGMLKTLLINTEPPPDIDNFFVPERAYPREYILVTSCLYVNDYDVGTISAILHTSDNTEPRGFMFPDDFGHGDNDNTIDNCPSGNHVTADWIIAAPMDSGEYTMYAEWFWTHNTLAHDENTAVVTILVRYPSGNVHYDDGVDPFGFLAFVVGCSALGIVIMLNQSRSPDDGSNQ